MYIVTLYLFDCEVIDLDCCDLLYYSQFSRDLLKEDIFRHNLHYELLNITIGNCNVYFHEGEFDCSTGDIIIIPPNVKYRIFCENPISFSVIGFDIDNYCITTKPFLFKYYDNTYPKKLLTEIKSEFDSYRYNRKQNINLLLNLILINLSRNFKACDTKKIIETDNFNYILNLMDTHSNLGFEIEDVAKTSGLSYHRFRHKFKEIVGISPQQYIIKQRLNFAKRLLETTNYTTSQIAKACGFNSIPQFITCFNKQEGLTPIKYRKNARTKVDKINSLENTIEMEKVLA